MRVLRDLRETRTGEQAAVSGQGKPRSKGQVGKTASPGFGLAFGEQAQGDPLAASFRRDRKPAEMEGVRVLLP
jgi:hypothetical protein